MRWQAFRLYRQDEFHDAGKSTRLVVRVEVERTISVSLAPLVIRAYASVPTLSTENAKIGRAHV